MKLAVIGTGYVGLVTGTCFAEWGHDVVCVDKDSRKIAGLQRGEIPIYEPGLDALVAENAACGRLTFTLDTAAAVAEADAVFIAVGTPPRHGDGEADLAFVYAAAREIAGMVRNDAVVVTKSTVPVGTGDVVERIIALDRRDADISVVSNPEFLREGSAIADFQQPDRVVVGTEDARARDVMLEVYRPLQATRARIIVTQRRTAELIKYAANAFLATKLTFINEIADLCESVGAGIDDVALGIGLDSRIGTSFLDAGPGYGGSCFPKDTLALLRTAQDHGVSLRLVEDTVAVNEARKRRMALKVMEAVGGSVEGLTIAVLGLTFKPNTDDMREAPSLPLINALQRAGAQIRAYDPEGMEQAAALLDGVAFATDPYACAVGADAAVLVTEWQSLKSLDLERIRQVMRAPVFVDLRNAYAPAVLEQHGFTSVGVGRPGHTHPGHPMPRKNGAVRITDDGTSPSHSPVEPASPDRRTTATHDTARRLEENSP